jgi:hypothetical protein
MMEGGNANVSQPLTLELVAQPDDTSCGPTCLHGVYRYYGRAVPLRQLMEDITSFDTGGTLSVHLGIDALRRGYRARIYSYNLRIFDPSWFPVHDKEELLGKLRARAAITTDEKRVHTTRAYIEFLELGGEVRMTDFNSALLRKYLRQKVPILTGLSATYLYQAKREHPVTGQDDDVAGEATGHFVVLTGYDPETKEARLADPYGKNPIRQKMTYSVKLDRLVTAILLGVLTYDANLLIIRPHGWGDVPHENDGKNL